MWYVENFKYMTFDLNIEYNSDKTNHIRNNQINYSNNLQNLKLNITGWEAGFQGEEFAGKKKTLVMQQNYKVQM